MLDNQHNPKILHHLETLASRYPALRPCIPAIQEAFALLAHCFENGGKLLVCGNGGSAADADHIVGELMKGFYKKRPLPAGTPVPHALAQKLQGALPAIALTGHTALSTAFLNDVDPNMIFAQQVYGYGNEGDVFLGISTSGNAQNVVAAAEVAAAKKITTIALTGQAGGRLAGICQCSICVPETVTAYVQELHLPVYHTLCAMLEEAFFAE